MNRIGRTLVTVALAAGLLVQSPSSAVPPDAPDLEGKPIHGIIASFVGLTLMKYHYDARTIDDEISEAWLKGYIDSLDYSRLYFLQSDIDEFSKWSKTLDDDIRLQAPQLEASWAIHRRYRQRVNERLDRALKMLDQPITFDDPKASIDLDRHEDPWATSTKELDRLWREQITDQLLRMELTKTPESTASVERLRGRYKRIKKDIQSLDAEDILAKYLRALSRIFDPHSVWFKPNKKEDFDIAMRDTLTGIGAQLRSVDGYTVITGLIAGGPAEASNALHPKDKILAVGQGREGEPVDIIDMRIDRVVKLIRGPIATEVHLVIHPGDATDPAETKDVYLTRDKVKLSQAAATGIIRDIPVGTRTHKVGVIDIPSFYLDRDGQQAKEKDYGSTARDVAKILKDFKSQGVQNLVIDLRENGGGSLDQAVKLTGLFLPVGPVVQIRDRKGNVEVLRDEDPSTVWDGPVVVLTSEFSASASEIFAAALQDYRRGVVVGSKSTHGKGSVQQILGLNRFLSTIGQHNQRDQGGAIKFTSHMFFRVNGESTQIKGVKADIPLPSPFDGLKSKEGDLEYPLAWNTIVPVPHKENPSNLDMNALRTASRARVNQDPEFTFLRDELAKRDTDDEDVQLSLHLDTRRKDIEEAKAKGKSLDEARKKRGWDGDSKIDPILDEAVQIAVDIRGQIEK